MVFCGEVLLCTVSLTGVGVEEGLESRLFFVSSRLSSLWQVIAAPKAAHLHRRVHQNTRRPQDYVWSAVFNSDGGLVLTASKDSTAKVWRTDTGECTMMFDGHKDYLWSAVFNPDGGVVPTASKDSTAKVWRTDTASAPSRSTARKTG